MRSIALLLLCTCALLGGCAHMPPAPPAPPPGFLPAGKAQPPLEIGVLVARWHTGLVLPAGDLGPLKSLLEENPRAKYVGFGWGNRRFYMAAHPGSGDAIAALFASPSVLFVQAVSEPADLSTADARIHWACVDREELWRVDSYIEDSLSRRGGNPVDLGKGPLPGSRFYASIGHYSAVHTCNTWTIAALEYAGMPVKASGVLFASQADRRARALRACPAPQ